MKSLENVKNITREAGVSLDPKMAEKLIYVLKYAYGDQLELQIPLGSELESSIRVLFSALLKVDMLKEGKDLFIKKYSRISEKNFSLFGIIAQSSLGQTSDEILEDTNAKNFLTDSSEIPTQPQIKEAIFEMISKMADLEKIMVGKLPNEIVIDPIAIYRELWI